jgi:hypothetical protein
MLGSHEWLKNRDTLPNRVPSMLVRSVAPRAGLCVCAQRVSAYWKSSTGSTART